MGSPSRTVTPTPPARDTATPEPFTATVRYYLNLTRTRYVVRTSISLILTQTQSSVNIQRTQTKQTSNNLTQTALNIKQATANMLHLQQTATSVRRTQIRNGDNINATIEVLSGSGTRTRTQTSTRRPTNTKTETYIPTLSPTRSDTRTITSTPTARITVTPSNTVTLTPTKVVLNNGSISTSSDIVGAALSSDESILYGFTKGDPSTSVLPSLENLNTNDLSTNSADDIPMLTAALITQNINIPDQIGVVGNMNSNTMALQLYDTSTGSAVALGTWIGTTTDIAQVVLMTGRYVYIGTTPANQNNTLMPIGRLIMIDISNPLLPVQIGTAIQLTGPPTAIKAIANSEFRFMVVGTTKFPKMSPQGYITTLKTNGLTYSINNTYITANPIADAVIRSTTDSINRTHTIYAAVSGFILSYSINELSLGVAYMNTIKQPSLQYKHLQLSRGGSYLYAVGLEPLMNFNALVSYDIRRTPQFRGFFGQFINTPQQLLVGTSQLFMLSEDQIFAAASMSTLSGIQSNFGPH